MSNQPTTTLIPFAGLPPCAFQCGQLHDANGACVPPAAPAADEGTYASCFCKYPSLQPWRTGASGVCDYVQCDQNAFSSIQGWFTSYCGVNNGGVLATGSQTGLIPTPTGSTNRPAANQGSGDWLSNHWRYVIMLVVLVVGIAGIWVGACIWRRRYLKRKERAHQLGKHSGSSAAAHNSWGPGATGSPHGPTSSTVSGPGVFMAKGGSPATTPPVGGQHEYDEKPSPKKEKKRWVVGDRT